jgi:hypothetical protein
VGEDVETLKRRLPLLDYLRQHNWASRPAGRSEFVGLCPLHEETRPSFYVNTRKDVFYCHGCGQGGDLIRFVQLSRHYHSARASHALIHRPLQKPILSRCLSRLLFSISSNWITTPRHSAISTGADCMIAL